MKKTTVMPAIVILKYHPYVYKCKYIKLEEIFEVYVCVLYDYRHENNSIKASSLHGLSIKESLENS